MNTQLTKPSNVSTAGILLVVGGIMSLIVTMSVAAFMIPLTFCIWTPLTIYGFVASILSIVKGANLLGDVQPGSGVPVAAPVLLMVNLMLNFDIVGAALGLVALIMLQDSTAKNWLTNQGGPTLLAPGGHGMQHMANVTPGAHQLVPAASEPQWGAPAAPPAPAPPVAAPPADAGWGTATADSEAAADRAAAGNDWSDWGAGGGSAAPGPVPTSMAPAAAPSPSPAAPSPAAPSPAAPAAAVPPAALTPEAAAPLANTPIETPAVTAPATTAPAKGDGWGDWSTSDVSVQETPPEADPLRPEAWDLAGDLKKPE